MTYKEAVIGIKSLCTKCEYRNWANCGYDYEPDCAMRVAIEAIENQIKYRWHDLRKNPDDLPINNTNVYIAYRFKGSEKVGYYLESFVEGEFLIPADVEVVAWRYIEPFEEENT